MISKSNKCQSIQNNNYKMNHWIERHIIFPKINEIKLKEQKAKEENQIRTSIITELKRNKSNSLYSLKDVSVQSRDKNLSAHKIPSHIRRNKKRSLNLQNKPQTQCLDENNQQNGVKYINIIELLDQRKHSFDSIPLKNMLKKLKYQHQRQQTQIEKLPELYKNNGRNFKKRYIKSKLQKAKTEPHQQPIQYPQDEEQEKKCLQIKKMIKFDYNAMKNQLQAQRQIRRKSYLKKKQNKQFKQTKLKITSIKGWNNQYQQLVQYI